MLVLLAAHIQSNPTIVFRYFDCGSFFNVDHSIIQQEVLSNEVVLASGWVLHFIIDDQCAVCEHDKTLFLVALVAAIRF